jgi:hypothetical protein
LLAGLLQSACQLSSRSGQIKQTSSSLARSETAPAFMTPPRCLAAHHRAADPAV